MRVPRHPAFLACLIILAVGAWYLLTLRDGHSWGGDFSMYINHARNLVEGRPYATTGYILNPHNPIAPRATPPGFPLLLAPVYALFGLNLTAMKVTVILSFLAALGMIFLLARRQLPAAYALALIALIGFNPLFWAFKEEVMSDFPFLFATYATIALATFTQRVPHPPRRQALLGLLTGCLLALCVSIREVGVVLGPSMVIADLIRHRRITRSTLLAMIPLLGYVVFQQLALHTDQGHLQQFGNPPRVMASHWSYYGKELRDLWRNGYAGALMRTLFLVVNGLALTGYWQKLRRDLTLAEIFPILYVAVILSWPHYQGIRFLFPVIPLYLLYALYALQSASWLRRINPRHRAFRILVVAALLSYAGRYTTLSYGPTEEGVGRPETAALFEYVRQHTDEDAVVIFAKPRVLYLYTGRRAAVYHGAEGYEGLLTYLRELRAGYAIACPVFLWDREFFIPFLRHEARSFEPVFATPDCTLYRFIPTP